MGGAAQNGLILFAVLGLLPYVAAAFFGYGVGRRLGDGRSFLVPLAFLAALFVLSFQGLLAWTLGGVLGLREYYAAAPLDPADPAGAAGRTMLVLRLVLIALSAAAALIGFRNGQRVESKHG